MKIVAVCCTFLRPQKLGQLIRCFEKQDYAQRELIILDDAGQYDNQEGDRWRLVSTSKRYPSLGEKRNAAVALVPQCAEAIAVWDDDDIYLPWSLSASVAALQEADWSRPSKVLKLQRDRKLRPHKTGGLFHASWAYRRSLFERAGGYPAMNSGEDQAFARRLKKVRAKEADPISLGYRPFFVWGIGSGWHISLMGKNGYKRIGQKPVEKATLVIADPTACDLEHPHLTP